jgi:hypothetical protein
VQSLRTKAPRAFFAIAALSTACGGLDPGDPHSSKGRPPPEGLGHRIYDIADPASPDKAAHKTPVNVTGAVVVVVDTYDETKQGNSAGTIYVNDLGSKEPYSGLSLFNPSFIPGNLRVSAGDTLDLRGEFQENQDIPLQFAPGAFLVQLASPIATYRFDAKVPDPIDIDINDLADYAKGRRWLNMIVRVRNVTLQRDAFTLDKATGLPSSGASGRVGAALLPEQRKEPFAACSADAECASDTCAGGKCTTVPCEHPFPKPPTVVNELMDLVPLELKKETTLKELVGLVTFFCNLHIAPRSAEDIVR